MESNIILSTLKQLYAFITIPLVIYILKLVIDHWNLTDLEKFLLSNYKKFQLTFIKICSWGIFFIFCLLLGIALDIEGFLKLEIPENQVIPVFLTIFIVMFILSGIFNGIIHIVDRILSLKNYFTIVDENGQELFKVIKITSGNRLLVEDKNIYTTLENYLDLRYKKNHPYNEHPHPLYSHSKLTKIIMISLFIISIILLALSYYLFAGIIQFLMFSIGTLLFLIMILLLNYSIDYKKLLTIDATDR